jgi:hypothetical protein
MRNKCTTFVENRRHRMGYTSVDRRIIGILRWILEKLVLRVWTGFTLLRMMTSGGFL